ncbi:MAG: glycoside hydrolase family 28 protein [Duncaniella sp.]|nr:glycoside hydrolase family 28 protein [Duncaniella sp.]
MKRIALFLILIDGFVLLSTAGDRSSHYEALRESILSNVTGADKPSRVLDIKDFGAVADGITDCRAAFDAAIQCASERGGAVVNVTEGAYYIKGPITFRSNVTINLDEDAVILFSPDADDYPVVETSWEGTFLSNYSPFIYGKGLHDVAITGKGTIDGNAGNTFALWRKQQKEDQMLSRKMNHDETPVATRVFGPGHLLRPHLIQFYDCERVTIEGVKIINSPFWCIHLLMSQNIICRGVRFDAKLVNNDGIDPDGSQYVIIENIDFDNGDDNIAIKSGRDNDGWRLSRPSSKILIRDCRFKGLHGVVIGSEMSGGVEDVIIENCTASGYCKRGIYVKTNADRGAYVRNIFVKNCRYGDVEDLFYVTSRYASEGDGNTRFSRVSDIHVDGLSCATASAAALVLQGAESEKVSDVSFDNIEVGATVIGISFENVENVTMGECHIGGHAGTPTQITDKDKIFR